MHRLLINPGTPQAWEIQLRPGANRIGRGDHNDFQVPHGSISGTHCEIIISSAGILIKDLGSTNGTFINRAPVKEAVLQSGQHLQLGSVDMVFESTAPGASPVTGTTAAPAAVPPVPPPVPIVARTTGGLRLSGTSHTARTPAPEAPVVAAEPEAEEATATASTTSSKVVNMAYCKFHPKTPARFFCNKCKKFFCDMCVSTRAGAGGVTKKTCRACGAETTPVLIQRAAGGGPSFFSRLPGAFVYPFKGMGVLYVLIATIVFSALKFVGGGLFGIFITAAAYGFIFLFMQNIIHTTTSDENTTLELPSGGDLGGGFIALLGTIVMSFWLYITLWLLRFFEVADIPGAALIGANILGCLYCPMAILAIAMKDSVLAGNPLVVFPAILRMPLEYIVTALVLLAAYGINEFGNGLKGDAAVDIMRTKDMTKLFIAFGIQAAMGFMTMYLLTASMRVLGLLYVSKKQKFGWFAH
jgi:hypothetical protein